MHWAKLHLDEFDMQLLTRKKEALEQVCLPGKKTVLLKEKLIFRLVLGNLR